MKKEHILKYQPTLSSILKNYLDIFCERNDCEVEFVVGSLTDDYSDLQTNSIINIADGYFNISDIIFDVENRDKIAPEIIFIWYWDNITHRDLNYESATKMFSTESVEQFQEDLSNYRAGLFGNPKKGLLTKQISDITEKVVGNSMLNAPLRISDIVFYINERFLDNGELENGKPSKNVAELNITNTNKVILLLEGTSYDLSGLKFDLTLFNLSRTSLINEELKNCLEHIYRLIV